jgi:DNA polymerase-3 subunit epsilon
LTSKKNEIPLISFSTKKEGTLYLERICDEHSLCQKLSDLYPTKSACFHYSIKKCAGACIGEETPKIYNIRIDKFVNDLCFNGDSFYIVDKGRQKNEKSLVLIERGSIVGYGYAPYHFQGQPTIKWNRFIDLMAEDRDARTIINGYLRKNTESEIVRF